MEKTHSSLRYIVNNIWYILVLSLLPAACLAGMTSVENCEILYTAFFTGNMNTVTWAEIFHSVSLFNFTSVLSALFSLFSFFAIVLCAGMLLALIDKHMRIGKLSLRGIVEKLNDNVMSTCGITLLYLVLYEVWALIFSALVYVVSRFIESLILQYVLLVLLILGGGFVLLYVVAQFYLWLPCLQITGYRTFDALRYSNQLMEKHKLWLVRSVALSLLLGHIFIVPTMIFLPAVAAYIVLFVVYIVYYMVFIVRMEVLYFDTAQLEREDLNRHYEL